MASIFRFAAFAAPLLLCAAIRADDPRVAPADHKEFSPNRQYFLFSSVKDKRTKIFRASKPTAVLWEIPAYLEIADLANDGKHVAASYEGGNILDDNVRASDPLVTFYSSAGAKRVVTVGEVVPQFASLPRSSSGRPWGRVVGFQPTGRLLIILNSGKTVTLDPEPASR